jgi:hypothetical protein
MYLIREGHIPKNDPFVWARMIQNIFGKFSYNNYRILSFLSWELFLPTPSSKVLISTIALKDYLFIYSTNNLACSGTLL